MKTFVAPLLLLALGGASPDAASEIESAHELWQTGRYAEAEERFTALETSGADPAAVAVGLSRCLESTGRWDEARAALDRALEKQADNAALLARAAELEFDTGHWSEASHHAEAALKTDPDELTARWVTAQLAKARGDFRAASGQFESFIHYYNARDVTDSRELVLIGLAASEYARWNRSSDQFDFILNGLYADAVATDPNCWQAHYESGVLLLEKHNEAGAVRALNKALAINSSAAPVYVALGLADLEQYNLDKATAHCNRALGLNPQLPAAHRLKAMLDLMDAQVPAAIADLEKARAVNAVDEETLGLLAACYVWEDGPPPTVENVDPFGDLDSRFGRLVAEVVGRNPRPGVFFASLARAFAQRQKLDFAETFFRTAVRMMPQLPAPPTELAMVLLQTGREKEGRELLEEAFKADPFNVRAVNTLKVLDLLETYDELETDHFHLKFDPKQDALLAKYLAAHLEQEYAELVEGLGYEPRQRSLFEVFNEAKGLDAHQWFSARTVGLPRVHTIGACIGKVVALTSPLGMKEPVNWARVAKHEFVHVINLEQTNYNVPRWLTEGLAVYFEGYPRPQEWNTLLKERVPAGRVYNLDNIDQTFVRPGSQDNWTMAYCQGELYVEYLIERYGKEKVTELLAAYRDGLTTPAAIAKVAGEPVDKFEEGYRGFLEKVTAGLTASKPEPAMSFAEVERAYLQKPDDADLAARLALEHLRREDYRNARKLALKARELKPNHPRGSVVLAQLSVLIGDDERAREYLAAALDRDDPNEEVLALQAELYMKEEKWAEAAELYELGRRRDPYSSRWPSGLVRVYLKTGDDGKLAGVLKSLVLMEADNVEFREKLAELEFAAGDYEAAARSAMMAIHVDVKSVTAHRLLADAYRERGRYPEAIDEYTVALGLDSRRQKAELLWGLAQAHKAAGNVEQARSAVEGVLGVDPDHGEAKKLLESLGEKPQ